MARTSEGLTPQQSRFVDEYLVDLNGTAAYKRAGYKATGKAAEACAARLLGDARVARIVKNRMEERSKRTEITADVILHELLRIARADVSQAFTETGDLKPLHEIPEDVRRAISGIEVIVERDRETGETAGMLKKVRFWDKTKGLELLGKHLKLFTEKHEHSGGINLNVVTGLPDGD